MSGKNGMKKSKNKVYRWIAMMLTAALLVGQCQAPVLANEGTAPVETGVSDENKDGTQTGGTDVTDKDASEGDEDGGMDNGGGEGGAGNGGTGEAGDGADNGGTEEGSSGNAGDGAGSDNGGDSGDGNGETGSGNEGADDDGEDNPGAGDIGTGDESENNGGGEGALDKCVCETACTEDAINEDCPVCAADYAACAKNAGEGVKPSEGIGEEDIVSENDLDGEEDIAQMAADVGVEVYAVGDDFYDDGLHYKVIRDGEVEVCAHRGPHSIRGSKIIPESVVRDEVIYRVTQIGDDAFKDCVNLTSVTIPESVISIGYAAFSGCDSLTDVTIPKSVTSIKEKAFFKCKSLNSVEIPEGVKRIASGTFQRCTNLTRVTIPESVTGIGSNAFYYCNKLTSIETLKNVTGIGDYAFFWCSSLTNIELSENLGSIGMYAFDLCGFSSVEIPEEVNVIGFSTFSSSKLTSVTIKASKWLLTIVDNAFYGCRTLNEMRIVVLSDGTFRFPRVVYSSIGGAFDGGLPDERYIRFVDEDGNEVTGQVYDEVFAEAAKNDDDGDDSKWYGWSYKEYIRDCEKKSVNKVIHFRTSMIMTGERLENKLFALFYV